MVIPSLELFVFNYIYIICDICSDMLTCLFRILIAPPPPNDKNSIRIIEILSSLTKNNPNHHWTCHTPSDFSITSLSSLYPLHFYPFSIHWLHLFYYVTQEVWSLTGDYKSVYDHQKTTCILARRVRDWNHTRLLTSYTGIYH